MVAIPTDPVSHPPLPAYTFDQLRETGVLWAINAKLLHPLGLALGLQYSGTNAEKDRLLGWYLQAADDGVWEFDPDDPQVAEREAAWNALVEATKAAGSMPVDRRGTVP